PKFSDSCSTSCSWVRACRRFLDPAFSARALTFCHAYSSSHMLLWRSYSRRELADRFWSFRLSPHLCLRGGRAKCRRLPLSLHQRNKPISSRYASQAIWNKKLHANCKNPRTSACSASSENG